MAPVAGALKLTAQIMLDPTVKLVAGLVGVQATVAPVGSPDGVQLALLAALGPALVHVKVPVAVLPAGGLDGNPVMLACKSACNTTAEFVLELLLLGSGSVVVLAAAAVIATVPPLTGAIKLTSQLIVAPTPSKLAGLEGLQMTFAPAGKPVMLQLALAAMLGPLLVHVTLPVTTLPAAGFAGKPDKTAARSACGMITNGLVSVLFAGAGSSVVEPAVALIDSGPLGGATKVDVQVIALLTVSGLGAGLGTQLCVAPGGNPLKLQLAAIASLTPLLVHVPETVTGWPALTLAGTLVTATISANGTTLVLACTVLLAGAGSALDEPAVPVTVSGAPLAGAV